MAHTVWIATQTGHRDGLMTIHNKRNKEIQHTQHMKHVVIVTDARINLPYTRPPILNNAP